MRRIKRAAPAERATGGLRPPSPWEAGKAFTASAAAGHYSLLVAAGMMSIPWMLLLTLAIFAEKALLHGKRTSAAVALGLVAL